MKFKKIAAVIISSAMAIGILGGCGTDESVMVSYNPSKGLTYEYAYDMFMDFNLEGEDYMEFSTNMSGDMVFSEVSENGSTIDTKFSDFVVKYNTLGEEVEISKDNSEFAEVFNLLKSLVVTSKTDKDGNITETAITSGDEALNDMDFSSQVEEIVGGMAIFNDEELKEGKIIDFDLSKSSGGKTFDTLDLSKGLSLKLKVDKIKDGKVVLKTTEDELEVSGIKIKIDGEYTVDLKTGLIIGTDMDLSTSGVDDTLGEIDMDINLKMEFNEK